MIVKNRIAMIRLADRLEKNKAYAQKVGMSVELRNKTQDIKEKENSNITRR